MLHARTSCCSRKYVFVCVFSHLFYARCMFVCVSGVCYFVDFENGPKNQNNRVDHVDTRKTSIRSKCENWTSIELKLPNRTRVENDAYEPTHTVHGGMTHPIRSHFCLCLMLSISYHSFSVKSSPNREHRITCARQIVTSLQSLCADCLREEYWRISETHTYIE